jgi:SAM-dependent methyltransferase
MKPEYRVFDEGIPEFWAMKYSDRWMQATELIDKGLFDNLKVLDIGCGMGRALSHFKKYGATVIGVEPSVYASRIAAERGIPVINNYFENTDMKPKQFDIIHIEQVLSHTPNDIEVLSMAKDLLKDDGVMVIEEPNDYNELQKQLEVDYGTYWVVPDHCNYYNFDSIRTRVTGVGLRIVKQSATFPMELFEIMGDRYIGDETKGREVHRKRYELEKSLSYKQREKMQEAFAQMKLGRDLVVFLKKGVSDV